MRMIQVCVELDEADYRAYEDEARREGTTAQALVERVVRNLFRELKDEERRGDHPILFP